VSSIRAITKFSLFLVFLFFASFGYLAYAQEPTITVEFFKSAQSLTYVEYLIKVIQCCSEQNVSVNFSVVVTNTSFPIDNIVDVRVWVYENETYNYTYWVPDIVCSNETTENGTQEVCVDNGYEVSELRWRWVWKDLVAQYTESNGINLTKNIGIVEIPDIYSQDHLGNNGTKWFKVRIEFPLAKNSHGWGSYGEFGIILNETYYHPWWNVDWRYRRSIIIDNTANPNTLTDYQVLITLDTASIIAEGKMRSDCGDIRFTYYDESSGIETEIPYWIESDCNSVNTKIWVKVSEIPANSYATIYVYYGNPDATSISNAKNVFYYYQNFTEEQILDTTVWKVITSALSYSFNSEGLALTTSSRDQMLMLNLTFPITNTQGISVESRYKTTRFFYYDVGMAVSKDYGTGGLYYLPTYIWHRIYCFDCGNVPSHIAGIRKLDGMRVDLNSSPAVWNTWYKVEIRIYKNTTGLAFFIDDVVLYENASYDVSFVGSGVYFYYGMSVLSSTTFTTSYLKIRAYSEIEPLYSIGSEEAYVVPISVIFSYTTIDFGAVESYTTAEKKGIEFNATIETTADYRILVSATDWSGVAIIPVNTLYFAVNSTVEDLTFDNAKQLSTTPQEIAVFPSTVNRNYHAYYFNVPLVPPGTYNTILTITYEVV